MRKHFRKIKPLMRFYRWYQFRVRNRNIEIDQVIIRSLTFRVTLDVGANVGYYSELLSRRSELTLSFEPVSDTFKELQYSFGHRTNLRLFNYALGERDYNAEIRMPRRNGQLDAPSASMVADVGDHYAETITVRQGDLLLAQELTDKTSKIDLIKIDVEGFEYQVMHGLSDTIKKINPVILVEINLETTDEPMRTIGFLENMGYHIFVSRVAGELTPISIDSCSAIQELQKFDSRSQSGFNYQAGDTTDYIINFWFVHENSALRPQLTSIVRESLNRS